MDLCKYAFYKDEEKYMPKLYCNINNGICMYSKKCLKVERFIPLENEMWKECYRFIMARKNDIPKGSYLIQTYRPNKNGKLYLYILVNDKIEKILSNFTEINQDYIYMKKTDNGYDISLTPFVIEEKIEDSNNNKVDEKPKRTYKRKTVKTQKKNYE